MNVQLYSILLHSQKMNDFNLASENILWDNLSAAPTVRGLKMQIIASDNSKNLTQSFSRFRYLRNVFLKLLSYF